MGHLPSIASALEPYYNEVARQPFRITTGPARDAGKGCGILFDGNNVIEGFRQLGFHVLGVGGVSQFSTGSFLRTAFPWSKFFYFGPDMDEEPLTERKPETFPLNHVEEIVSHLGKYVGRHGQWFLFINCPEPHYPYDWGEGIPEEVHAVFSTLSQGLNLRSQKLSATTKLVLAAQAKNLHQMQINGLEALDPKFGQLFDGLRSITSREIFVFVTGDHGENFGEDDLYGHMHPTKECMSVPLWMGVL
ncbi:MAG TPA: sulfatase-like hydrolase/transferase [Candidatus Bathyarchaeia archaeon]|nr:sulfatase-like hydrolase/transferase [Candidatus Bathyarchaeia archaeon]